MSGILFEVLRTIGLTGCIVLGLLGYYEGVPWLRDVPFLGSIPIVGEMAVGRVRTYAAEQVDRATAGLVAGAELAEQKARGDELQRQLEFNSLQADAARKQADTARVEAAAAMDALEKRIEAEKDPTASRWNSTDCQRVRCQ